MIPQRRYPCAAVPVIVSAFSEDQVQRLTGISRRQLRYWDRTGFFTPSLAEENRRIAFSRIYSFTDVVSLRALNVLRNQYGVSLQHLRKAAKELPRMSEEKWGSTELFVLNRQVIFVEPETEQYREIVSKQYVIGIPLRVIVSDTMRDVDALRERGKDISGSIVRSRNVCRNAWVVAGTRIRVESIKQFAKEGYTVQQIQEEYPTLTEADIEAALRHEGDVIAA